MFAFPPIGSEAGVKLLFPLDPLLCVPQPWYVLQAADWPRPQSVAQFSLNAIPFPPTQPDHGSTDHILQAFQLDTVLTDRAAYKRRYHTLLNTLESEIGSARAAFQWERVALLQERRAQMQDDFRNVYQRFTHAVIPHRQVLQLLSQRAHDEGVAHIILVITAVLRFPWLRGILCLILGISDGPSSSKPLTSQGARKCFKCGSSSHEVRDCPNKKDDTHIDNKDSGGPYRHKFDHSHFHPYGNTMA